MSLPGEDGRRLNTVEMGLCQDLVRIVSGSCQDRVRIKIQSVIKMLEEGGKYKLDECIGGRRTRRQRIDWTL